MERKSTCCHRVIDEVCAQARRLARQAVELYPPVVAGLDPTLTVYPEFTTKIQTLGQQVVPAPQSVVNIIPRTRRPGSAAQSHCQ